MSPRAVRRPDWRHTYSPATLITMRLHQVKKEDPPMLWKKRPTQRQRGRCTWRWWGGGGMRFGGGKGLSLTAILLIVGIGWITGQDPLQILGQLTGQMSEQSAPAPHKPARRHRPMMKGPNSCARSSAIPKTPGARFSSRPIGNIKIRPWCCSATASTRPAAWRLQQPVPSIARLTRRSTWT